MIEEDLCAIGFMFDAEHDREERQVSFRGGIEVTIKTIGDKPGHVQSGQYLWPAAKAAGEYLIDNWGSIGSSWVLELGAGCGLSGIVASKLNGVEAVVWTDYDRGSLQLITENTASNCSCRCFVHFLEWGVPIDAETKAQNKHPDSGFRLIIGSDLIYCKEVIVPLFKTVADTLSRDGVFVLTSSFALDEVSLSLHAHFRAHTDCNSNLICSQHFEAEIERICASLELTREQQIGLNESKGVCKVEHYTRGVSC
jgi:predicted nicotinamide N-methyase